MNDNVYNREVPDDRLKNQLHSSLAQCTSEFIKAAYGNRIRVRARRTD